MMLQSDKVEKFKYSGNPKDSIHAKFNATNFSKARILELKRMVA